MRMLRLVPKNHLSQLVGWFVHRRLPRPIARRAIRWFASTYEIDTSIASRPIEEYQSIGEFFVRELKEGTRRIEGDLVSPVDGTLRAYGKVENGVIEQVKGKNYYLQSFLGHDDLASEFDGGVYFNLYLSPQDYHHVHSPVAGRVVRSVHIPGKLWPVNDWSISNVENLFSVNERIVTYIDSGKFGLVALVMIGATNVGKMSVVYDAFVSNQRPRARQAEVRLYDQPHELEAGSKVGTFHMGSSVVILFKPGAVELEKVKVAQPAKLMYGQALTG
jgi:phosphatidylserine decarboxylase